MLTPKVTIITATYNSAKTLRKTILSILEQDYFNIEYIIIDGGSTDNTIDIINNFIQLFNGRLKYISENDNGIYDAWNKGLKISSGEWISFLGSDDYYTKDAISSYIKFINFNPTSNFVSSKCMLITSDYKNIRTYGSMWTNKMNSYCTIAHVGSFHKKNLFKYCNFNTEYKVTGDYDFLLKHRNIIIPFYFPKITAYVMNTGVSGRNIFFVSKERTIVKLKNRTRSKFMCYFEYFTTILKFYLRKYIIN